MHKSKIKQITLAVCLALMPLSGFSAGLGKLNVSSGLGEPLKAEIELLSVTPEELSSLVAAIAPEDAYAAQGITRLAIHNNIQVQVAKSTSGAPILKLRSALPVSDPYLDMLIQVDWSTGRLQREYTVLLDPPGYKEPSESAAPQAITAPITNTSTISNSSATASSGDTSQAAGKKSKKNRKGRQPAVAQETSAHEVKTELSGDEITTKKGDTLSNIARQVQADGVSLDQMLIGLYESNKDAFAGGNMNRLKVGQIIKVPTKESLVAIDAKDAHQQVKVQSANWNEYRNKLAGTVASAPAMAEGEQKQAASGKISTAEDKAAPVKTGPQDVVKLSAGENGKAGNAKEFESKITALQEESTAREKSLKEAQERTAALEKQIQDMQKLLALKNQTMANAQKSAETAAKTPEPAPAKPAEVPPAPATQANVEVKPQPAATAAAPESKSAEVKPAEVAPAAPEAQKPETKPVEAKKPAPVPVAPPPAEEPSLIDSLLNSIDLTIVGALGGIALLGAGWMFLRNKRRKDLDSFERGILTSGGLRANTVFGNTTGSASTSDTSFLTDFAQSADGSMIDTNDVDPIAEAEVYMAYGRDAQAEEILKDAISKEPKRYELHLKLLEMYAARKDTSAFEAIAGELYTTLGADDPTWAKVATIGAEMEPENPLYNVSPTAGAAASASTEATQKLDISDFANVPVSEDTDLDFSFDAETPDAGSAVMESFAAAESPADKSMSFDLGSLDSEVAESFNETTPNLAANQKAADNSMDFNLGDFDLGSPTIDPAMKPAAQPENMQTMDNLPAFNLPEIDAPETQTPAASSPESLNFENTIVEAAPTFDMAPTFDLPVTEEAASANANDLSSNDFSMDFDLPIEPVAESPATNEIKADEISFDLDMGGMESPSIDTPLVETPVAEHEISFDLPEFDMGTSEESAEKNVTIAETPNEFDLSTISLDLTEPATETADADSEINFAPEITAAAESEDVNIKLDLVSAYIDMGDKEGARELLEEVLKEGGPQQQTRAQEILASLA